MGVESDTRFTSITRVYLGRALGAHQGKVVPSPLVRCKWDSMCKIHELGQCLTVRLITDVPGHDQAGCEACSGQPSAIFASPRLIASASIAVSERARSSGGSLVVK